VQDGSTNDAHIINLIIV